MQLSLFGWGFVVIAIDSMRLHEGATVLAPNIGRCYCSQAFEPAPLLASLKCALVLVMCAVELRAASGGLPEQAPRGV